jgi:hypothetical protein
MCRFGKLPWSEGGYPTLYKPHYQEFTKRLRQTIKRNFWWSADKPIKYYACGEYGEANHRPHYHAIIYNLPQQYNDHPDLLAQDWKQGITDIGKATVGGMAYVTKYISKTLYTEGQDPLDDRQKEFSLMSKGLGSSYLTPQMLAYYQSIMTPYLVTHGGQKLSMPRYYRDKIYDEDQLEIINDKTLKHLEQNPTFADEKAKRDYTINQFDKQKKYNQLKRQTL